jgi:hypothetical protein
MLIPDKFARTVRLLVRFEDGLWRLSNGEPLPKLKEDTLAELIVPVYELVKQEDRDRWTAEHRRVMYPKGTSLWAKVSGKGGVPRKANGCAQRIIWPCGLGSVVEIRLTADLQLLLRPGKMALLEPCACAIPVLDATAASLNEAYTRISQKYEPHRRSHTGSAFKFVHYDDGKVLRPLDDRRLQMELEGVQKPEAPGTPTTAAGPEGERSRPHPAGQEAGRMEQDAWLRPISSADDPERLNK